MALLPNSRTCRIAKNGIALLAITGLAAGALYAAGGVGDSAKPAQVGLNALGSVLGNAAFANWQTFVSACRERPPEQIDENHVILRTLRDARVNKHPSGTPL